MSRGKIVYKVTVYPQKAPWRIELMQLLHLISLNLVINTYCVKNQKNVYLNTEIKFILKTGK